MENSATVSPVVSVVEDDHDMRQAIAECLSRLGHDVRSYSTGGALLCELEIERPGCVVLDLHLPDMHGKALQQQLRLRGALQPVLVVTGSDEVEEVVECMRLGARDIVRKPVDFDRLAGLVAQASHEDCERRRSWRHSHSHPLRLERLSKREREVATLVAQGLVTREIALRLGISPKTVDVHRSHAVQKLGLDSVAQLVRILLNDDGGQTHQGRLGRPIL